MRSGSSSRFSFLFGHDLFGKPLCTFPDHALATVASTAGHSATAVTPAPHSATHTGTHAEADTDANTDGLRRNPVFLLRGSGRLLRLAFLRRLRALLLSGRLLGPQI